MSDIKIPQPKGTRPKKMPLVTLDLAWKFHDEYSPLCPSFGKNYKPDSVCKRCDLTIVCMVVQKKKIPARIEILKQKHDMPFFFDEYVAAVTPERVEAYIEKFVRALEKKGGWVKLKKIGQVMMAKGKNNLHTYFKSNNDSRLLSSLLIRLTLHEKVEYDSDKKQVRYVHESQE